MKNISTKDSAVNLRMHVPAVSFHTADPFTSSHWMSLFVRLVSRKNPTRQATITEGSETRAVVDESVMLDPAVRGLHDGTEINKKPQYLAN